MLYFDYTGISSGKYVTGEIQALNQEEAAFKLKNDKIIITKLIISFQEFKQLTCATIEGRES